MTTEIENFTRAFFTNLGAKLEEKDNFLIVSNVNENFEKFYGKKSPYILVFEKTSTPEEKNKDAELMVRGSFMLNCMKEFLENKGQTSIIKLLFDFKPIEEIKKAYALKNCNIDSLTKKEENQAILRFTFLTNFQYLNEKEQLNNSIYIKDNIPIEFNLDNFKFTEGKKEDILIEDVKFPYNMAKERLKIMLEPKIQKTGEMLDSKLKKELERIKKHYSREKEEITENLNQLNRQLEEAKKNNNEQKIKKIEESKKQLEENSLLEKLNKEEAFFINDETHKHSLNISTKLVNTTIIYYPIFTFSGFLKNNGGMRIIELKYNPIKKEFSELSCDCCKTKIQEIYLCAGGHISCKTCLRGCSVCQKDYCTSCLRECSSCSRKICRKCTKQCSLCGKHKCLTHFNSLGICDRCR